VQIGRAVGIKASQSDPEFLVQYFYEATNLHYFLHFLLESSSKEQLGKKTAWNFMRLLNIIP